MKEIDIVMLVDDSETDNFINKRVIELTKFSKKIIINNSGRNALEFLLANQHTPENLPDLIFLDINMPIVDGFVFLYEFEDFPENIKDKCKIIILSSSTNKQDIDRIVDNRYVIDYVTKPLSLDTMNILKQDKKVNGNMFKHKER
jgi:CheY-like chemotaxis protein